jgi:hypothetical protein
MGKCSRSKRKEGKKTRKGGKGKREERFREQDYK